MLFCPGLAQGLNFEGVEVCLALITWGLKIKRFVCVSCPGLVPDFYASWRLPCHGLSGPDLKGAGLCLALYSGGPAPQKCVFALP